MDFCVYHYSFGDGFREFRLLRSRFHINAVDVDIHVGGFSIFNGFRECRAFLFLGGPISQTC